jgi:hypothetical protein
MEDINVTTTDYWGTYLAFNCMAIGMALDVLIRGPQLIAYELSIRAANAIEL